MMRKYSGARAGPRVRVFGGAWILLMWAILFLQVVANYKLQIADQNRLQFFFMVNCRMMPWLSMQEEDAMINFFFLPNNGDGVMMFSNFKPLEFFVFRIQSLGLISLL